MFRVASSDFFGIFWQDTEKEPIFLSVLAAPHLIKGSNHMNHLHDTVYNMLDFFYWKEVWN